MDLRPYGIQHTLVKKSSLSIPLSGVQPVIQTNPLMFEVGDDTYKIVASLGEGSYGKIYDVEAVRGGGRYALKVQHYKDPAQAQNMLGEAVIHVLLMESSATEPQGPYVPHIYQIGHMAEKSSIVMLTQRMEGELWELLDANQPKDNNILLPHALIQCARALEYFQTTLHMNHRDLKANNIMYVRNPRSGAYEFKLIDMGFACLDYNGVHISGTDFFPTSHVCERISRDCSQLIMEILLDFPDVLSPALKKELRALVRFELKGTTCELDKYCEKSGLASWNNSYRFLNRPNVENPHATPAAVQKAMIAFLNSAKGKTRKSGRRYRL
jgi:serine/threonine protein kinase